MRLREAQLPGKSRAVDGGQRCSARAALAAGDQDHLRAGLGDAGGHRAHAGLGDQLHGDARVPVGALEIVDQLRQILDGVDVVVRRRGDQRDSRRGAARARHPRLHLCTRQMAALAGLRALGHLDLNFVCGEQVLLRHAEAPRSHLLDGGIELRAEALRQLAALAGVGLAADVVHGLGHALVGLLGEGAVGHRAGLEAVHDLACGLHLRKRNRRAVLEAEVQQRTDGSGAVLQDEVGVALKQRVIVVPHGLLQRVHHLRGVEVLLRQLAGAQPVQAHAVQRRIKVRAVGHKGVIVVPAHGLLQVL